MHHKEQAEHFHKLSLSEHGAFLVQYVKELIQECESARGKANWEEAQGGLQAGKILQEKLLDKLRPIQEADEGNNDYN